MEKREQFASRLGFILMSAGCAIGLGNVWRFPYVAGQNGGGFFVLMYFVFLAILGCPVLLMELALGRAGRSTFPGAFRKLQNPKSLFSWQMPAYLLFCGNLILLMFYTVITGWLLAYGWFYLTGKTQEITPELFSSFLGNYSLQIKFMLLALFITVAICFGGIRKTIEKSIKVMMLGLLLLLMVLVIQALCQKGASAGVKFFLMPDVSKLSGGNILSTVHAAMAQAFFTLSLGIGSIAICGSYFGRERSLFQEGFWIIVLDTFVAVASGLVIFPACAAFGINPDAGPSLIFITLPKVFQNMNFGTFWGILFFIFLAIGAISTLVAVFENLVAFGIDELGWKRPMACSFFGIALGVLSLPCIFGFNLWKNIHLLGENSNILDFEDFIVSDNLLPLGAMYMSIFCMNRYGWQEENFYNELNTGKGWKFPGKGVRIYLKWFLPLIIFAIWVVGLSKRFPCISEAIAKIFPF